MPDAVQQMKKALFGPNGYKNGVAYDFESKGLLETANSVSKADSKPSPGGFSMLNVPSPGGMFGGGMAAGAGVVLNELREKNANPTACGGCGVNNKEDGKALLVCARCKDRKYCSTMCQKKHWKAYKNVCEPAKVAS
jgi:hypothetical protein